MNAIAFTERLTRLRAFAVLALTGLVASAGASGCVLYCSEGRSVTPQQLAMVAIQKLVVQTHGMLEIGQIRYESVEQFLRMNPDCCFVTEPDDYLGEELRLPLRQETVIAIRYRRYTLGEEPFAIRWVTIYPCPSYMDESEQRLSLEQYEASKHWVWGWRIR